MKIGFVVARIGGEDGVALEIEKWIDVLDRMGHQVYIIAGVYERCLLEFFGAVHRLVPRENQTCEPLMSFSAPEVLQEQRLAFLEPDGDEIALLDLVDSTTEKLTASLVKWIHDFALDVIISENASALPLHLSLGIAIRNAVDKTGVRAIAHDHDFFWERGDRYVSPYKTIHERMEGAYPLLLPSVRHALINTPASEYLLQTYGVASIVVPNVMDFSVPYGVKDGHNLHFLPDIGIDPECEIALLQVTRIVRRKGVEVALELIHRLDNPIFKLVITGSESDTGLEGDDYLAVLREKIAEYDIGKQVVFAGDLIETKRGVRTNGQRLYQLSDVYARGRGCCYFSHYEGFGNAFVEAVCGRQPLFVNNYKPVYWPEIGSKGFRTVQIENGTLTDDAVEETREILLNPALRKEIVDFNFELGRAEFSYEVLAEKLSQLLA